MKKQRGFLFFGILLLTLFMATSIFTFHRSRGLLERGYLAAEGNAAESFAVLTAANIKLTDAQVERLKCCSYAELMNSPENESLRTMMAQDGLFDKVHFAYVMILLPDDEAVYTVTAEMKEKFDAPVGTKLNIMWLMDVVIGQTAQEQATDSDELTRYSYYIEEDEKIFFESPTYIFNSSEWGDHICGYAPLYTTQGRYIGVVGVELEVADYVEYCGQAVFALGVLMCVSLFMLSVLFAYIYLRYRRVQFDRVYLDALVQVYNRSYFNNRFGKYLNAHRDGKKFALMIADVDWFKKVNDTFGHEIGDEVLTDLGSVLVQTFDKPKVIRLGGEEFVVAVWYNRDEELKDKLDTLFKTIEQRRFSSAQIPLSISLGCSCYEPDEITGWLMSGMLRAADCKLYEAKEGGRRQYLLENYDPEKEYAKTEKNARAKLKNDNDKE